MVQAVNYSSSTRRALTKNLIRRNETVPSTSAFKIYKFRVPVSMRAILVRGQGSFWKAGIPQ
jgi:hypothetical protein